MLMHSGEKPFVCEVCGRSFSLKTSLQEHKRTHTGDKPFECSVCHRFFRARSTRDRHQASHSSDRPFRCSFCVKAFTRKDVLAVHEHSHRKGKQYLCLDCGTILSSATALTTHRTIQHGTACGAGKKCLTCPEATCGKRFHYKNVLEQHTRTHQNQKPVQCPLCAERFVSKQMLKQHEVTHYRFQKIYHCPSGQCSRTFNRKGNLKRHRDECVWLDDENEKKFSRQCVHKLKNLENLENLTSNNIIGSIRREEDKEQSQTRTISSHEGGNEAERNSTD